MTDLTRISGAVLTLASALILAGCAITDESAKPAGSIPTTEPGAVVVYLNECGVDLVSAPRTFTLTCADAGKTLQGLVWTAWGSVQATATGREVVNLCVPDCAAGKVVGFPVSVTASQLTVGRSASAYIQLTVTAESRVPHGVPARESFTLDNPDTRHSARGRK